MRLLLVSDEFPWPLHHGTYLRVFHIARQLGLLGHAVTLLAPGASQSETDIQSWRQLKGVDLLLTDSDSRRPGYKNLYSYNDAIDSLIDKLPSDYDAAITFHARSLPYCRRLREHLGDTLIIADLIDDYGLEQRRGFRHDWPNILKMARRAKRISEHRGLERSLAQSVDLFSFVGQIDADSFAAAHPCCRTAVIANGVDIDYFRPVPQQDGESVSARQQPVIVFPGRFVHPPNVQAAEYLIKDIGPRIRAIYGDLEIVILGADPPESLQRLAGDGVTITGYVDDMRPHLRRADIVALPMLSGTGIKNKLLEAWASGVAVVATELACQGASAVDGENLLVASNAADFAASVVKLLGDADLRKSLAKSGLETVCRHYSWKSAAEKLINAIKMEQIS